MKRRKAFIALALTMCMLVPTSVSAVENNQPAGQQTESVDGQTDETTEFTTKDPNELPVVDAKDPDEGTKDDPKDEEEKQPVHTGWYQNEEGDWYLYDEMAHCRQDGFFREQHGIIWMEQIRKNRDL